MIYVLIMIVSGGSYQTSIQSQEFTSKEKCETARVNILNTNLIDNRHKTSFSYWYDKSVLLCVEK